MRYFLAVLFSAFILNVLENPVAANGPKLVAHFKIDSGSGKDFKSLKIFETDAGLKYSEAYNDKGQQIQGGTFREVTATVFVCEWCGEKLVARATGKSKDATSNKPLLYKYDIFDTLDDDCDQPIGKDSGTMARLKPKK